jgi:hypothetical protein
VEDLKRKQDLRREQAERLRDTMARRREEKEQQHLEEVKVYRFKENPNS